MAHLAAGVASAVVALAFVAIRGFLRERGDGSWSAFGLAFVVFGSTLYALLPGMEFAPLAAVEAGSDAEAAQSALQPWFLPLLLIAALTFALGALAFAKGIVGRSGLNPGPARVVVAAIAVFAASHFVPLLAVQAYVQAAAAAVAHVGHSPAGCGIGRRTHHWNHPETPRQRSRNA